ncbi:MAG: 4Fe-4S dicluster domain-containing protein, partial [Acidobacteria bacterium]|nr:4Fe-4S dicluster domain-containing protein [Acidobacteriota bacterium]
MGAKAATPGVARRPASAKAPAVRPSFSEGGSAEGAKEGPDPALLEKCVHCGFCLPSCPTYMLWGEEMDSPRGRIYLMRAEVDGRASMTDGYVRHFDACLGCMACVTSCP